MTYKVTIWLTNSEYEALQARSEDKGVTPHQLATAVTCALLGTFSGKKLKKWTKQHEMATRSEKLGSDMPPTEERVRQILAESKVPMTTREITKVLGWKSTGGLSELLKYDPEIERAKAPADRPKKRGAVPFYYKLKD